MKRLVVRSRFTILALAAALALFAFAPRHGVASAGAGPEVHLISSDSHGLVLNLDTLGYSLSTRTDVDGVCGQIQTAGFVQTETAGEPQLPVKVVLLGVPPGVELVVTTTPLATRQVSADFAPCAAPEVVVKRSGKDGEASVAEQPAAKSAVFSADRLYPTTLARVEEVGFVRSQRIVRLEISPFQVNPVSGVLQVHEQLRVALHFAGEPLAMSSVSEPDSFESALSQTLLNYQTARSWRSPQAGERSVDAWAPPQPGYRVLVRQTGLYQLTRDALAAAGLPVGSLDPRTLKLFNAGKEIAIAVTGEADGRLDQGDVVLFFGEGADTRYTDTNVYWLTYGNGAGLRTAKRASQAAGAEASSFLAPIHLEDNLNYISSLPKEPGVDHWYGQRIQAAGSGNPGKRDFTFNAKQVAAGALTASLEVMLGGNVDGTHHLRLYVNGQQVHEDSWQYRTLYNAAVSFPQSYLHEGSNTVRVELANDTPGQAIDMIYVGWLEVRYGRKLVAEGDALLFGGDTAGAWRYAVSNFSSAAVDLFDVTDPTRVVSITGATVAPEAGLGNVLRFGDNQPDVRRYLAVTAGQRLAPVAIEAAAPSDLLATSNGADYIIITHPDFRQAVEPLAAHRASQGYRVKVVETQEIYDRFNYGMMSAEAIRDFVAYAYTNWQPPAPSYVLLMGDGTYDFRHYLASSAPTYLPPYLEMVDFELGETSADNRFVAVSGDDNMPDLNIGRLPANTAAEATAMVEKVLAYETLSPDEAWVKNVYFVADDLEGGGGNFYDLSDNIADGYVGPPGSEVKILPSAYTPIKSYLGKTCADQNPSVECRQQIIDTISTGALMVSFIGHGTKTYWAEEHLYDPAALTLLSNGPRLPVMLPMTCNEGYFQEAQVGSASLSEIGVRMPVGGAVASWAPTGFGLSTGHDYLERGLFLSMFHDSVQQLGAATTDGKIYLVASAPPGKYRDLIDTFLLLGDPALRVPIQAPAQTPIFLPLQLKK